MCSHLFLGGCPPLHSVPVALNQLVERLERDHDHRNVVQAVRPCGRVQYLVHRVADYLMYCLRFIRNVMIYHCPYAIMHLLGREFVKNTVATRQHIVQFLAAILLEIYVWVTYHDVRVAAELWLLRLEIAEGPAHREPPWEHPVRTNQRIVHCVFFKRRLLNPDLL